MRAVVGPRSHHPPEPMAQLKRAETTPPQTDRASPEHSALIPEGVESVITGLGTLCGDGQKVGGAAACLDAA